MPPEPELCSSCLQTTSSVTHAARTISAAPAHNTPFARYALHACVHTDGFCHMLPMQAAARNSSMNPVHGCSGCNTSGGVVSLHSLHPQGLDDTAPQELPLESKWNDCGSKFPLRHTRLWAHALKMHQSCSTSATVLQHYTAASSAARATGAANSTAVLLEGRRRRGRGGRIARRGRRGSAPRTRLQQNRTHSILKGGHETKQPEGPSTESIPE